MAAHDEVSSVNYSHDIENRDISEIRDILEGFVSKKASNDITIGEDRSSILASSIEEREASKCTEVGQVLVSIADEIDMPSDVAQGLMERVGAPNVAFETFKSVAKSLFSWNSVGGKVGKSSIISMVIIICHGHHFSSKNIVAQNSSPVRFLLQPMSPILVEH